MSPLAILAFTIMPRSSRMLEPCTPSVNENKQVMGPSYGLVIPNFLFTSVFESALLESCLCM